jgi:hypothetical protein
MASTYYKAGKHHYKVNSDGVNIRIRSISKRKHLNPSSTQYHIHRIAYFLSLNNPNASMLDNWLQAERYINTNYPD